MKLNSPLLNNPLLDIDAILLNLEILREKDYGKPPLEILQDKLKWFYFGDKTISNSDARKIIASNIFVDFPRLRVGLDRAFLGNDQIVIPEGLKDWSSSVTFHELNRTYGYFEEGSDLADLFNLLAVACRKMTTIFEKQAHDDEMAYKLMALFYDPNKKDDQNFDNIATRFAKLIKTKQDKTIATPYHDAFVVALNRFPAYSDVKDLASWKNFIEKEGLQSLSIFAECATIQEAFDSIKSANEVLLAKKYPRAEEHPELAELCLKLRIGNNGFEAGLEQVKSGWPKKETDNLPIVDIADTSGQYFWLKIPPQDMRVMYLGNLIPGCCQFINGNSEKCVIDGMTLSDNGFYVLLKAKNSGGSSKPRISGHEINDQDFSIVAQSYAWKTKNGNLCLDSIEWHPKRVTLDVIQDLMSSFSKKIFEGELSIKYLTVGAGGQTPRDLFPLALLPEGMKQGRMYGDSKIQYCIASNIRGDVDALTQRLSSYSGRIILSTLL